MTTDITPYALAEAMIAAADWLEANPDHHITHTMAKDRHGVSVPPTDHRATCFCAAGRIAHELGVPPDDMGPAFNQAFHGLSVAYLTRINDHWGRNTMPHDRTGRRAAIKEMRARAKPILDHMNFQPEPTVPKRVAELIAALRQWYDDVPNDAGYFSDYRIGKRDAFTQVITALEAGKI